jgi:uncharacterized membrane protein
MANHASTITVARPVRTVYDQWTQFETFPAFMEGVERVEQLDDQKLHWTVNIAGVEREFDAVITDQQPDRRIAWESTSGPYQAGEVTFEPVADSATRVTMELDFEPEGLTEHIGDAVGFVSHRISGDLDRFKSFVEEHGETGAWRGTV